MIEPSTTISLRMSIELWTKISNLVNGKDCPNFSHAARSLIQAGLWLNEHKNDLTNPETSQKFIEEYNSKTNENNLFAWTGQLTDIQIQGMQSALELEKEKRIK